MLGLPVFRFVAEVLEETPRGPIVAVGVRAPLRWPGDSEVAGFVRRTIERQRPAGVVLDLLGCRRIGWSGMADILLPLLARVHGERGGSTLPVAIVARGGTAGAVRFFLECTEDLGLVPARASREKVCSCRKDAVRIVNEENAF